MTISDDRQPDTLRVWRNARLVTLATDQPGHGIVERGAVVARDGRIVFAGPEAELPATLVNTADVTDSEGGWSRPA